MEMVDGHGHDLLAPCVFCGGVRAWFCKVCGSPLCALCATLIFDHGPPVHVCSPYKKLECRATVEMDEVAEVRSAKVLSLVGTTPKDAPDEDGG